jgi:hypothetical protein
MAFTFGGLLYREQVRDLPFEAMTNFAALQQYRNSNECLSSELERYEPPVTCKNGTLLHQSLMLSDGISCFVCGSK